MSLSDEQLERYARHIVLREIGGAGQMKLRAASIAVIGAGGIGCPAIQSLAAAGIGRLRVIDDDHVALSNLQRQLLFETADIGRAKVEVAAERIARLTPDVAFEPVRARIDAATAERLIGKVDLVLDGSDNFATRLAVSDWSVRAQVPLVTAAIGQFQGQLGTFRGWRADAPCYRCFVGDAFDAEDCDTCAEQGVLGAMTGLIGSWAAMEAIRALTGFGPDASGKLHVFDGITPRLRTIAIPKDPACRGCGSG